MLPSRIVLLLALLLTAGSAVAQTGPIVFDNITHDFGTIPEDTLARHVFIFRNAGESPLRLTDVSPSCGCTTPHWSRGSIAPGDTGHVAAVFDSANRPGSFSKTIRVSTNAGSEPVTLRIHGTVKPPPIKDGTQLGNLLVGRQTVDLGTVSPGRHHRTKVAVKNTGARPIQFTDTQTPNNLVSAYVPSRPLFQNDRDEITVGVRTYGMTTGDTFSYPVTLVTDDESQPQKTIRVTGRVE